MTSFYSFFWVGGSYLVYTYVILKLFWGKFWITGEGKVLFCYGTFVGDTKLPWTGRGGTFCTKLVGKLWGKNCGRFW